MPADKVVGMTTEGFNELMGWLKDLGDKGAEQAKLGLDDWTEYTFEVSQGACPTDKGELAGSGEVIIGPQVNLIRYTAPHARPVHYGYARHWVGPRNRKALRWEPGSLGRLASGGKASGARYAYSKGHYVGPSRPNPWLFNSVAMTLPMLREFLLDRLTPLFEGGM
jgi:hypothetical protein